METLFLVADKGGGRRWIRTIEGVSQQIYSLPPLATWVSYHSLESEVLITAIFQSETTHSTPGNERSIRYRSISHPARIFHDKSKPSVSGLCGMRFLRRRTQVGYLVDT